MNRKEYLEELKKRMASLCTEEQENALRYYEDYFEDADNDERVMAELGTPEELAKTLISNIPGMPVLVDTNHTSQTNEDTSGRFDQFANKQIKELYVSCNIGVVTFVESDSFYITYNTFMAGCLTCKYKDGLMTIESNPLKGRFNIFTNIFKTGKDMFDITVHMPSDKKLEKLSLVTGVGSMYTKGATLTADQVTMKVSTGQAKLMDLTTNYINAECGMGNIEVKGTIKGGSLKCGMGNISMNINGNIDDYSINGSVGMGNLRFGKNKQSGTGHLVTQQKANHFDASVGMGNIEVSFN